MGNITHEAILFIREKSQEITLPGESNQYKRSFIWGLYRIKKITPYRKAFIYSQKLAIVASKTKINVKYCFNARDKSLYLGILGYITYRDKVLKPLYRGRN